MEKITEMITERGNYDTRKVINRSGKEIPQAVLDSIETDGISSEQLNELGVPVFKYKTQVTVHGRFPELAGDGRVGHYKCLIRNQNESVGVRYNAVDHAKKQRIYNALHFVGWPVHKSSTEWSARKISACGTRADLNAAIEGFKAEKEKIDTSLFFGDVSVAVFQHLFLGVFAGITINIGAVYAPNVDAVIANICGKPAAEIEAEIAAKELADETRYKAESAIREKEIAEYQVKINVELESAKKPLIEAGLEYHAELPLSECVYIRPTWEIGKVVYRVRYVFKHGKSYRAARKDFDNPQDAIAALKTGGFDRHGSKELQRITNAWTFPKAVQAERVVVGSVTVRKNEQKGGIEVVFLAKPEQSVIDSLKSNGFRWSGGQGLWWKHYSDSAWQFAKSMEAV